MPDRTPALPPLEWIRAFDAAARLGSFTAAAAETGLTQSAISQRIAHLEKHLGTRLFLRQPRAITLTVEGETWHPHVTAALSGLHDSTEALFGRDKQQLTIAASQTMIALWVMPRLADTQARTGAALSLQTLVLGGQTSEVDDTLQIRYGTGAWPHRHRLKLYDEEMAPLAAPALLARGLPWTDLPRIACTGPRPGWMDYAAAFDIPTTPVAHLRCDTFLNAVHAAVAGLGVVMASLPLCHEHLMNGSLVRVTDKTLPHDQSYWLLAGPDAIRLRQWDAISMTWGKSSQL